MMAPLLDPSHYPISVTPTPRLVSPRSTTMLYSGGQVDVLECIILGCASFSFTCAFFSFYWFVRMRRSFRHDLIMLLIQSDLIKSLWLLLFPIIDFTRGPIASDSAFCQVSGFFLAVGIESSDVAILLITLHSAIYIFRPRSGLYPYRRLAYALYILFPLLVSSLVFVGGNRYENVGQYCYLENRGGWTRPALSWVPRYVIFALVVTTYICIYAYVRSMTFNYKRKSTPRYYPRTNPQPPPPSQDVPPTPKVQYHDFAPSTPGSTVAPPSLAGRRRSSGSIDALQLEAAAYPKPAGRMRSPGPYDGQKQLASWNWTSFSRPMSSSHEPLLSGAGERDDFFASPLASPLELPGRTYPPSRRGSVNDAPSVSNSSIRSHSFPHPTGRDSRRSSAANIYTPASATITTTSTTSSTTTTTKEPTGSRDRHIFSRALSATRRGPFRDGGDGNQGRNERRGRGGGRSRSHSPQPGYNMNNHHNHHHNHRNHHIDHDAHGCNSSDHPDPTRNCQSVILSSRAMQDDVMGTARNRDKIHRQLRSLFVYPLAYIVTWIFPLVSHALGYDDSLGLRDPFWLLVASAVSLAVQGSVDSAVFVLREEPWRHVQGGFWESLIRRRRVEWNAGWRRARVVGRTREEMLVDGRIARTRRKEEMAAERVVRRQRRKEEKVTKNWWDAVLSEDENEDEGIEEEKKLG